MISDGRLCGESFESGGRNSSISRSFFSSRGEAFSAREAAVLFMQNETDFVGAVENSHYPAPGKSPVVIGKWKYSDDGIFIRVGALYGEMAVRKEGRYYNVWLFDIHDDGSDYSLGGGFFVELKDTAMSKPSLASMKRAIPVLDRIVSSVRAYESIVASRREKSD